MSHTASAWAYSQTVGSARAKLVLVVLADFAGSDESCAPQLSRLADITEMSETEVAAHIDGLADLRFLTRHEADERPRYRLAVESVA